MFKTQDFIRGGGGTGTRVRETPGPSDLDGKTSKCSRDGDTATQQPGANTALNYLLRYSDYLTVQGGLKTMNVLVAAGGSLGGPCTFHAHSLSLFPVLFKQFKFITGCYTGQYLARIFRPTSTLTVSNQQKQSRGFVEIFIISFCETCA